MDRPMKYLAIIVLLLGTLLHGCFYATRSVLNAGVRSERVSNSAPEPILMTEDGAIALKVKMVYVSPDVIDSRNATVTNTSFKYLVGSRSAVECSISNALNSDFTLKQRAQWKDRLPENILYLTTFPYDAVNDNCGWQLIPSSFGGSDVTEDMLPDTFKPARRLIYKDSKFPVYKYHDVEYALIFSTWNARGSAELRTKRRMWWGYPLRILIIPAIPFDILTWPIQLLISPKIIEG